MGIVTTDDRHYKNIAAAIKSHVNLYPDGIKPEEMATGITDVYDIAYGNGHVEGEKIGYSIGVEYGKDLCAAKHFVQAVTGDGTGTLSVEIPFEPDCITVYGYDPLAVATADAILQISVDLRGFSYFVAGVTASKGTTSAPYNAVLRRAAFKTRFEWKDFKVKLFNLPATSGSSNGIFAKGAEYIVCAQKYTEKTDVERITEFVRSLPDTGGDVTLTKAFVNEVFDHAQWEQLIAERPNWTFTLAD